jgi:uncharacterized membrane protein
MHLKSSSLWLLVASLVLIGFAALLIFVLIPVWQEGISAVPSQIGFTSDTARARVLDVMEEGETMLGEHAQMYQILLIKVLEGPYQNKLLEIDYGLRQVRPGNYLLNVGDEVLVSISELPDGTVSGYFVDFVRTRALMILFVTFVIFSIAVSGWKGVRSLIALAASLAVILYYILPQLLSGKDPVLVSVSGAFGLLSFTLYLTYGWSIKTHAAVLGTLLALMLTGLLSSIFVVTTRMTGYGSEDALFLIQQSSTSLDLRGLVLGGFIIGALGVLDDLVITQASVVIELYQANSAQRFTQLFRAAMRVGRDHVAATVNTLVLAYTGAALPTMMLFALTGENIGALVNLEYVSEEIVRTLVGSLGLIGAVPITTALSTLLVIHRSRFGRLLPLLGPLTIHEHGETFHHH